MIHTHTINGLAVRTGDIICTATGARGVVAGEFWRLVGRLVPGDVDHVAVYVGPEGQCVEAGAKARVITFDVKDRTWDAQRMTPQRGILIDTFYGVAYPLRNSGRSEHEMVENRENIARYCIAQAEANKPYNLNFLNSDTEDAFYCSQLAYKAYLRCGINLNTGLGVPDIPGTSSIIFPQEIWNGCYHKRA